LPSSGFGCHDWLALALILLFLMLSTTSTTDEGANARPDSAAKQADEKPLKQDKQDTTSIVREMAEPSGQHGNDRPERHCG
jgi:hypothetical protein